jgi:FixJ family two-component response regulator
MKDGLVFLLEDDGSVRRAIARVLRAGGYAVETHASASDLLEQLEGSEPGVSCVVADVSLPGQSGLELQEDLKRRGYDIPMLFVTASSDVANGVRAMKGGAIDFLLKPIDAKALLGAVARALDESRVRLVRRHEQDQLQGRVQRLTAREREVFDLVVVGYLNKQVGAALGTSEKTVKVHRARVMEKMEANSLAELVRMADRLGLAPEMPSVVTRQARLA